MVDQETLDRATAAALHQVWPAYRGRNATVGALEGMMAEVRHRVALEIHQPFLIQFEHQGLGEFNVRAIPLETPEERAAREVATLAQLQLIEDGVRALQQEADRHCAAQPRAKVQGGDAEPFVSIPGMMVDLHGWQVPPDLMNGEVVGYQRALADVQRYLQVRAKRR